MSWNPVDDLRRPPVLKTFRLEIPGWSVPVEAESREAALAKIADNLREVR